MAVKQYEIVTRRNRSKKIYRIKESGIRIFLLVPNGGKELEKDSSEELIDKEDIWHGYHGRQQQTKPKKKLYFKIHEESFDDF